jgi:threonyl-tRNA synthetase
VRSDHEDHACRLGDRLRAEGLRVEVSDADEPLGARIRKAKLDKVPHVVVVGDDDVANDTVGDNPRGGKVERDLPVADFLERLRTEIATHA